MRKTFTVAAVAATLAMTATSVSAETLEIGGIRVGNPFDSATWWDGSTHQHGEIVVMNFADPDFWLSIPNPEKHSKFHGALTNPVTYAQFFKLETYTNMMDVDVWMKWFEADTYAVLADPQTLAYWTQPGAFGHLLNVDHYAQAVNPDAYGILFNAALANVGMEFTAPMDMLSLSGWMGSVATPAAGPVVAPADEAKTEG